MKPHVRYGHTTHLSMAGGGAGPGGGRSLPLHRRPSAAATAAAADDGVDGSGGAMIEEYKLEEQLAPFYETSASASERCASVRCFLPGSSSASVAGGPSSSSASSSGNKPTLRTVSIMETLSELASVRAVDGPGGGVSSRRRPAVPPPTAEMNDARDGPAASASSASAKSAASKAGPAGAAQQQQRRKKIPSVQPDSAAAMAELLDLPQWYPAVPKRPGRHHDMGSVTTDRVWDVSRINAKLNLTTAVAAAASAASRLERNKGRSVQDILSVGPGVHLGSGAANMGVASSSTSAHGYGSLERRRRRRPGARAAFALSARRGETDWEREEDEDEEDDRIGIHPAADRLNETMHHYPIGSSGVSALLQRNHRKTVTVPSETADRERPVRHAYKPPTEWFKKKRPAPPATLPKPAAVAAVTGIGKCDSHARERGQTPDWIHRIFHVARKGNLVKLQRVIAGMEPTLVRNLSDHRGNNLLHVLAGAGNADGLAWLCSSFGPEMQDALLDENKRGLTPVVAAIQAGRLEALQFLVDHTSARDRLAPVDGDRSLLHIAAKYGKIDLVAWLAQYMESHGFEIDLRDHCGHTPLHLAARSGHASAVAVLVAHGADVTAKNDMGHRPLDLASAAGHVGVAQLLRLHDAALCLSSETLEVNEELDSLRSDYAELKSYFRDVLVIGKRFAKERDEMCRQLGRLYEDVVQLHQALLFDMRTLHRDLAGVRDRVNSSRKAGEIADRNLDESVAIVEALHDKWQSQQRGWFSSSLADMEHRLLLAEDGWKRLRTNNNKHRSCPIRPQELLRSRLAAVNAQASTIQCDVGAFSSSEGSLYSGCHSSASGSDGEGELQTSKVNNTYAGCLTPASNGPNVPPVAAAGQASWYKTSKSAIVKTANTRSTVADTVDSVYSSFQAAVRKMNSADQHEIKDPLVPLMPPIPPVPPPIGDRKKPPSASKQELRKRLQEVKLTSESGNASVIEVIEPSTSEDDDEVIDGRTPRDQSTPLRPGNTRSFNASFSEELEKARQSKRAAGLLSPEGQVANGLAKSADPLIGKGLAEPDLLAGTVPAGTPGSSRSCHDLALRVDSLEQQDEELDVNPSTRSHSSLSSSNNTAITSVAAGPRKKSGGFLTKFAFKARWPAKRKSSPSESPSFSSNQAGGQHDSDSAEFNDASQSRDEEASERTGTVAGLSQMFEDLSIKSSPASQTTEKRLGNTSPSRNSLASPSGESVEGSRNGKPSDAGSGEAMDLPPSTSPPPVPLEIETYNSSPSSQEESSSSACSAQPPPPPPRFTKAADLSKVSDGGGAAGVATASSSASSSTSASHGGVESLSVAASEDSGIVMARPASSASKSDSSPRAAATASSYAFGVYSPFRKSSSSAATTADSGQTERLSPAPSDVSKAESTSVSDLSKTESMRHFRQLARIEEAASAAAIVTQAEEQPVDVPIKGEIANVNVSQQSGQILTWREAKLKNQVVTPPPLEERLNKSRMRMEEKSIRTLKKRHQVSERPWYDVSDDESDMLTPGGLTKLKTSLSGSDSTSDDSSEEEIDV